MIAVSDLARAKALGDDLALARRLYERCLAAEPLRNTLGNGDKTSEIGLSATYMVRLRGDITQGLALRINGLEEDLRAMGVSP